MQQQQLYEGRKQTTATPLLLLLLLITHNKKVRTTMGKSLSSLSCEASNICLLSPFYLAHFWPTILILIISCRRRRPSNEEGNREACISNDHGFWRWVGGGRQAKQMSPREGKHSHSHSTVTQMKPGDWGSVSCCYFCYCCCC